MVVGSIKKEEIKMKNVLRIDHKNARIIMDREFTIAASIFGSPEYKMLQQAKQDNDGYHVVRKTIKKNRA